MGCAPLRLYHLSMAPRRYQALAVLLALALPAGRAPAAPTTRPRAPAREADELRAACDELLRSAVRSHFGWGWRGGDDGATAAQRHGRGRQPVEIDLRATAAAGLALHLAGEALDEPKYCEGAAQAAKSVMGAQQKTGHVPLVGTIANKPAGQPDPAVVPDRSATVAALGLLLTLVESDDPTRPDARLRGAAMRAAQWLAGQQTDAGGWPAFYPGDGPGQATRRIVRLDRPAYRDATLALVLASRVLNRNDLRRAAVRSIDELLHVRVSKTRSAGFGLWTPAFTLGGEAVHGIDEFPPFVNTPATAYGMDVLLIAALGLDDEESLKALKQAATSAGKLPRHEGQWDRWYDLYLRKLDVPELRPRDTTVPTPEGENPFNVEPDPNERPDNGPDPNRGDFGLAHVLKAAWAVQAQGPPAYRGRLDADVPLNRRVALVMVGLPAEVLTVVRPDGGTGGTGMPLGEVAPSLPPIVVRAFDAWFRLTLAPRDLGN